MISPSLIRTLENLQSVPVIRGGNTIPRYNVKTCNDQIVYEIALPGYKKEDIKVSSGSGRLDVSSDTRNDYSEYVVASSRVAPFSLSFNTPAQSSVTGATMSDGILYVTIQTQDTRTIEVV
jgi:HSP20 family molecular chaperone IbpA